jgi:sialate O-acetylesterase
MDGFNYVIVAICFGLISAWLCISPWPANADVRMPHVFSNSMVLQRDMPVPVWGWAEPGEEVTVKFAGQELKAKADAKGKWMVKLTAMKAGGPFDMEIIGKNTIKITDILIGEVWVCSGQSNMQWGVASSANAQQEIAAADFPKIRLFGVPNVTAGLPAFDVSAAWTPCNPNTVPGFSAVGYFFGRELFKNLDVPIGLINVSWGGTRIEPWTPIEGFADIPGVKDIYDRILKTQSDFHAAFSKQLDDIDKWVEDARKALAGGEMLTPLAYVQHPLNSAGEPTGIYNAMVSPLVPYAIRGAIWYQGESNRGEGMLYLEKMKALIAGWRKVWNQGDFPFYYVQLAPYRYDANLYQLPEIWEAQTAALSIPNTGMAVTTDIGNIVDIHPTNKQDVGKRLSLWALAKTYSKQGIVYSGPLFKSLAIEGGKAVISFDNIGGGLASRDGKPLTWFEIAGDDKKFVKATATVQGDKIEVTSPDVPKPVAVRFGWNQEAEPNLMNKEGLPASPFRTDKW